MTTQEILDDVDSAIRALTVPQDSGVAGIPPSYNFQRAGVTLGRLQAKLQAKLRVEESAEVIGQCSATLQPLASIAGRDAEREAVRTALVDVLEVLTGRHPDARDQGAGSPPNPVAAAVLVRDLESRLRAAV